MSASSRGSLPEALNRAVDCFRAGHVPYVLIGAWALAVWGKPRATLDLDFLVLVNEEDLEHLGSRMSRAGMELDEAWSRYNPMLRGLQPRVQFRGVTIDLCDPVMFMTNRPFDGGRKNVCKGAITGSWRQRISFFRN